jgi:prolyl-tRNA synthetase
MIARKNAISPSREEDFALWYQAVIAPLAQHGDVAGTQVIKPWGYAIWERIQTMLDRQIKATGHQNFYAPLLMPLEALEKEANHLDFAKECAVVTHSRLGMSKDGMLEPQSPLTRPVVIRPTSEAIIGPIVKNWIQSHRDLPLKLNQWANVVRWEMRTRLFLRSSEFLWQEGHTFHANAQEAGEHAKNMLNVYEDFFINALCLSPIVGPKPAYERFAGANETWTLELMMQDGKALQGGTSHDLGQNFAKAYDIKFAAQSGSQDYVSGTSWGLTTRLIGALVMTHGDDDGLRLPPAVAPQHVVIIPVNAHQSEDVMRTCEVLLDQIANMKYAGEQVRVQIDSRDMRGGEKSWDWIKKGVPIRLEVGPRDVESQTCMMMLRTQEPKQKEALKLSEVDQIPEHIAKVHHQLTQEAKRFMDEKVVESHSIEEVLNILQSDNQFVWVPFLDEQGSESMLKEHGLTIRCLKKSSVTRCVWTNLETDTLALVARAY